MSLAHFFPHQDNSHASIMLRQTCTQHVMVATVPSAFILQEEDLVETLDDMGYEAHVQELDAGRSFRVVLARFRVRGMTCSTCVGAVEHALAGVRGVRKAA